MSMTYYAVTNDPNDLAHFGIPGMKWGVRHDRPRHSGSYRKRSAAYNRASSKLGKLMKSGIRKAEASWRNYNSPAAREERFMNKSLEKARKGTLKYGKLTDAQVQRITERLALERNARQLGNTEKPGIGRRVLSSIGEGVISGIGQGFAGKTAEVIKRGSVLKTERLKQEQQQEFEKAKERRNRRNVDRIARDKDKRDLKQKKREAELDREEARRKDEYEHDRDRRYMLERAQNAYLYGAKYTDDGKITGDSIGNYYGQRYDRQKTVQQQQAEEKRQAEREQKRKDRATAREKKEFERAARKSAHKYANAIAKQQNEAEAKQRRIDQAEAAAREAERIAQYRSGIAQLSADASERDRERALKTKVSRIREKQEREAYADRVTNLAAQYGRHAEGHDRSSTAAFRRMDQMYSDRPSWVEAPRHSVTRGEPNGMPEKKWKPRSKGRR